MIDIDNPFNFFLKIYYIIDFDFIKYIINKRFINCSLWNSKLSLTLSIPWE